MVAIRNRAGLSRQEIDALAVELEVLESLSDVIRWGRSQPSGVVSPAVIFDVVIQDEFTHDARVPWRGRALVFGST
jgi:hypothetical protein